MAGIRREGSLNFLPRGVLGVKNPLGGVAPLTNQRIGSIFFLFELNADANQVHDALTCLADDRPNNGFVAGAIARTQGVLYVRFHPFHVGLVKDGSHTALSPVCGGILGSFFRDDGDAVASVRKLAGGKQACDAAPDDGDVCHVPLLRFPLPLPLLDGDGRTACSFVSQSL